MNGNTNLLFNCGTVSKYDYVFTKTVTVKEKYLCVFSDKKVNLPSRTLKLFLWSEKLYFPPISMLFNSETGQSIWIRFFTSYQNDMFISLDRTSHRNSVSISRQYYLYKFTKNTVCQQRGVVRNLRTSAGDWERFDLKHYGFSVNLTYLTPMRGQSKRF